MKNQHKLLIVLELCIFTALMIFFAQTFPIGIDGKAFMSVLFLSTWFVYYDRIETMLRYASHLIRISILYIILCLLVSLVLLDWHILLVAILSILLWSILSLLMQIFMQKYAMLKFNLLVHPRLVDNIPKDNRVNSVITTDISAKSLHSADVIIIDRNQPLCADWHKLMLHANRLSIPVIDIEQFDELINERLSIKQLNQSWLAGGFSIPKWYVFLRTGIEKIGCVILLPLLLVIYAIVALIILITMGRPIFYNQQRMGMNGIPFKVYKFRSMIKGADKQGETTHADMRVTRFGAFMRKFRVDELPQFINILKGDMSLIGPRPEWVETAKKFEQEIPLYSLRYMVKPGITGWAQVTQGHTTGAEGNSEKLQYDLYYVKYFSPYLDIKIIVKTIYTVLTGFGAK